MREPAVGDTLPPFTRTTGFAEWNRYAAVNYEFVPIHMDDGAGQASGLPGAVGMGNLQWSYLHNMVRDWLAGEGRVLRMDCQFRGLNTRGQTITAHGVVTALDGAEVSLDVWTESAEATDLQRLAVGHCVVVFDKESA